MPSLLIVEDHASMRETLRMLLSDLAAQPAARVLIVTSYDDADLRQARAAGARGYVLKENLLKLRQSLQTQFQTAD